MSSITKTKSRRAATLADVGRATGVSAMAVSAVLNGARTSSRISPKTRKRIVEMAAKLQYRANATARALATTRMNTIGVAVAFGSGNEELNQYFLEIFNGILDAASRNGQTTTVLTLSSWEGDTERLASFCDGRIDGLILVTPALLKGAVKSLPNHSAFVAIHTNRPLPGVLNIETDDGRGVYDLICYLISQGHRRILYFRGPHGQIGAERRLRGYKRALAYAKIPFDADLVADGGYSIGQGKIATREYLARAGGRPLPAAIACFNDGVAVGCLEALAEAGFRVPGDVSVVGFDDTVAARTTIPQLTTVRQPLRAMGERAVDELLAHLEASRTGKDARLPAPVIFPVKLVTRDSVAPPAGTQGGATSAH
jgi:LacI family transcriptional regulator